MLGNDVVKHWGVLLLLFWLWPAAAAADTGRQIEMPVKQSITTRQVTQKEEERWRQEKEKLAARLEQLQRQQNELQERKAHLQHQFDTTQTRVDAKSQQLAHIEQITQQIEPFLASLTTSLKMHFADGLPFLTSERRQRIDRLELLMDDPDVDLSEKYRKVMEAMQVEADYGFTIETYQETITLAGQSLLADIFRLGRLGLYCLSLDGRQGGFYNPAEQAWLPLETSHTHALQTAIAIAAKRQPVELLTLPLGRLVVR